MADLAEANMVVAERIAVMLSERDVPVMVIGAVALAAHRYVRFTEDIDLGVNADPKQMRALAEDLRRECTRSGERGSVPSDISTVTPSPPAPPAAACYTHVSGRKTLIFQRFCPSLRDVF